MVVGVGFVVDDEDEAVPDLLEVGQRVAAQSQRGIPHENIAVLDPLDDDEMLVLPDAPANERWNARLGEALQWQTIAIGLQTLGLEIELDVGERETVLLNRTFVADHIHG